MKNWTWLNRTRTWALAAAVAAVIGLEGCGYTHGFKMPAGAEDVKTVAIDVFKNKTLYMDLETEFALALQREISGRTNLKVVDRGQADSLITGAMESYRKTVLREFRNDEVSRYGVVIGVSYRFIRLPAQGKPERVISYADRREWSVEFEVDSTITEADARARAVRRLAREVVNHIFEPWEGKAAE